MDSKAFLGFKVVDGTKEGFALSSLTTGYLYFVRTSKDENNGYLYFDNKQYGNVNTVKLGDAVGLTKNEEGQWVTPEGVIVKDGVTLATDVAAEMLADEKVTAAALNEHEAKIKALQEAVTEVDVEGDVLTISSAKTESNAIKYTLGSVIALSVDPSGETAGTRYIRLTGKDGANLGKIDITEFIKDGFLSDVSIVECTEDDKPVQGLIKGHSYIKFVWNTDSGKQDMYLDVTTLFANTITGATMNGSAVTVNDHVLQLVVTANDLTLGADLVSGETTYATSGTALNAFLTTLASEIETMSGKTYTSTGNTLVVTDNADGGKNFEVNTESATDDTVAAGHIEIKANGNGQLYGMMYYSGDDLA